MMMASTSVAIYVHSTMLIMLISVLVAINVYSTL